MAKRRVLLFLLSVAAFIGFYSLCFASGGSEVNFQVDIRQLLERGFTVDLTVQSTEALLGKDPFYFSPHPLNKIKKFDLILLGYLGVQRIYSQYTMELDSGQRIADKLFLNFKDSGFLIHNDESDLASVFKDIDSCLRKFDTKGRLQEAKITGTITLGIPRTLIRNNFKYDIHNRVRAYDLVSGPPQDELSRTSIYVYKVDYDAFGKIYQFLYGYGVRYGSQYSLQKYLVTNIKYNLDGEVTACRIKQIK